MKSLSLVLLLISFQTFASAEQGFVVNILPDKLTLPIDCVAQVKLQRLKSDPKKFSVGYSCGNKESGSYYMDFRLNDVDIVADFEKNSAEIEVDKTQFNGYTLFEIWSKSKEGEEFTFVSYCTDDVCLDLVGNYKPSVKDALTTQLKG